MDKENIKKEIIDDTQDTAFNLEIQQDKFGVKIEINEIEVKIEDNSCQRRAAGILKDCYVIVTDIMKSEYYQVNSNNSVDVGEEFKEEHCVGSELSCVKSKHLKFEGDTSSLKNADFQQVFGTSKGSKLQNMKISVMKSEISKQSGYAKSARTNYNLKDKKVVTINKYIKYKTDVRSNNSKRYSAYKNIHGENLSVAEKKSVNEAVEIKNTEIKVKDNKIGTSLIENGSLINVKSKRVADELNHDKRYECFTCGFLFTIRKNLLRHIRNMHIKERTPVECYTCGLITLSKSYLKTHQKFKHPKEEQSFQCPLCSYKTDSKYNLTNHHTRLHQKDCKLFTCTRCDFTTKYSASLKTHMKSVHEKCDADLLFCYCCKYKTVRRVHLVAHMQNIHQKEIKWYSCKSCSFKSKYKSSLNQHMKMYHDEKYEWPKCPHCPFQSRDKGSLTTHMKLKHKPLLRRCKLCNFRACWDNVVDAHVRKVHL